VRKRAKKSEAVKTASLSRKGNDVTQSIVQQLKDSLKKELSTAKFNITFTPEGLGVCLYTDHINLSAIGLLKMQRASMIEWKEDGQLWQVIEASTGKILHENKSRQACIDWEIKHFNQ